MNPRAGSALQNDSESLHAIYHPHTSIESSSLLKSALLLWDDVRTIVPYTGYRADLKGSQAQAAEILVKPHVPTTDEMHHVHQKVESLLERGPVPAWLIFEATEKDYPIYTEKMLPQTWHLLRESNVALGPGEHTRPHWRDGVLRPVMGMTVMAMLADACGGEQFQPITDRPQAFGAWGRYATWDAGGEYETEETPPVAEALTNPEHALVSRSLTTWRLGSVPLGKIVRLRQTQDGEMRKLRRAFARRTREYANRLRTQVRTAADAKAIEHDYLRELREDMTDLAKELGAKNVESLLGEGGVLSTVVEVVQGFTPWGLASGAFGVGRRMFGLKMSKKEIKRGHWTSWLYATSTRGKKAGR